VHAPESWTVHVDAGPLRVTITSRDKTRAEKVAAEIGPTAHGIALDLGQPETIAASLADVRSIDHLVLTAIEQNANSVKNFDVAAAVRVLSGISGLTRTLSLEIAPFRVNALHAGVVGDSPKWRDLPNHPAKPRTPLGRLVTMDEVADATEFLLRNGGVNGIDLHVDGGVRAT
jgi:NAD(P)-dependent dehydrogenase (short-subunit alcohol dehydrogenase family)